MSWLVNQARFLRQQGLAARSKAFLRKVSRLFAIRGMAFLRARPRLLQDLTAITKKLGFHEKLRTMIFNLANPHSLSNIPISPDTTKQVFDRQLSPRARRIYKEIQAELAKKQKM